MRVIAARLKDGTLIKEGLKILKNMGNNFLYVYNGRKAGKVELDETVECPSDLNKGYYMMESEKYLSAKEQAELKEKEEQERIENTAPIILEEQRKKEEQKKIEEAKLEADKLLTEMGKEQKITKQEDFPTIKTEEEVVEEVVEEPKFEQLTAEQLKEDFTIKEIKKEAEKRGYEIEQTRKDDIIAEFLAQQK